MIININEGTTDITGGSFIAELGGYIDVNLNGLTHVISSSSIFEGKNGGYINLNVNNILANVSILNSTFIETLISSSANILTIDQCGFNSPNGYLISKNGTLSCTDSFFTNTGLYAANYNLDNGDYRNEMVTVNRCIFESTVSNSGMFAVIVEDYANYIVSQNQIIDYYEGINLFQCGGGSLRQQKLEENYIRLCDENGITVYNSEGAILTNAIVNGDKIGIKLMNNCNFYLHGSPDAHSYIETQHLFYNTGIDIYCTEFSFPYSAKYNSIDDPFSRGILVKWERPLTAPPATADLRYNHWGQGFNPANHLQGNNVAFLVTPYWVLGQSLQTTPDEDLYNTAYSNFEIGNYGVAKSQYQLLIELYPKSIYAQAAMKDLFKLEENSTENYVGLQEFYTSNDSINNDSTLSKLAGILVNDCNIKLENFPEAVTYYENVIKNPDSEVDSIFAVIDLGYVYTLLGEQGLKSNFVGRYPQYKPKNKAEFLQTRTNLLSLIPGKDKNSTSLSGTLTVHDLIIYPNPAIDHSMITYSLTQARHVLIKVTNSSGKIIATIDEGKKGIGSQKYSLNLKDLSKGLYFYSLYLDGTLVETKKLVVM